MVIYEQTPVKTGGVYNRDQGDGVMLNSWYNRCLGGSSVRTSILVLFSLAEGWGQGHCIRLLSIAV